MHETRFQCFSFVHSECKKAVMQENHTQSASLGFCVLTNTMQLNTVFSMTSIMPHRMRCFYGSFCGNCSLQSQNIKKPLFNWLFHNRKHLKCIQIKGCKPTIILYSSMFDIYIYQRRSRILVQWIFSVGGATHHKTAEIKNILSLVTLCLDRIQFKRKINKALQSDLMGQTSLKTFSALTVEENLWNFAELTEIVENLRVSNTYW